MLIYSERKLILVGQVHTDFGARLFGSAPYALYDLGLLTEPLCASAPSSAKLGQNLESTLCNHYKDLIS